MVFINLIFFLSLLLIAHTYIIYPLSIQLISLVFRKKYIQDRNYLPNISILISAYNEENVIAKTLESLVNQDYDSEKYEIIVGSDGSTDKTNDIVLSLSQIKSNIYLNHFEKRRGKKFVINDLFQKAKGEVLVFCDSNTIFKKNVLSELVNYYADERIGGVSGRLELTEKYKPEANANKEATYWKYESWIKNSEGSLGCLIGANGGIYSIKKDYFTLMPEDIAVVDDLFLSLKILEQDKDMAYCKTAVASETIAPSIRWESERKVRIIPRSFETIKQVKKLLFSKRILISYNIWSHKVIRWFSPLILFFLFISNLILSFSSRGLFFNITLGLFLVVVFFGIIGFIGSRLSLNIKIFQLSYYFLISNYSLMKGFYKYVTKKYKPTWEPTPRK